jgi:hypothetical protein
VDKLFRFSDYDLFGYLAAGIIVFGLCDFTIGTQIVWKDSWSISSAVAVILGGYVLGHIVSGLAALIVDRWLVRSLLGTPANLLFRADTRKITLFQRVVLGDFLKPLHPSLRSRVLERAGMSAQTAEQPEAGEELFWRAWPIIKREPIPYGRADSFLKLYGFCRTLSFISFVAALVFAAKAYTGWNSLQLSAQTYLTLAVAAAVVSFVMFRRYLRFFRAYSLEVFSTFAEPAND